MLFDRPQSSLNTSYTGVGDKVSESSPNNLTSGGGNEKGITEPKVIGAVRQLPLTENCHHYEHISEVPWDIQRYWQQRHSIFSKYDDGIYMTDDAWFGVTPEPVANHVALDLRNITPSFKSIVIDIFAGAGGNAIAFALAGCWERVIAIEKDATVLACAQHNASIYGVLDQITWVLDDCFVYLSDRLEIDTSNVVIFASPPWGGPGYRTDAIFNLATMRPYSVSQIYDACRWMDSALYLPRTSDLRQLARLAPKAKVQVVQYCMDGASKALVAYIPAVLASSNVDTEMNR